MTSRLDASYAVVRRTGIPLGWTEKKVSDLVRIVSGGTPDRNESAYWRDGGIPWITPTDLTANNGKYIFNGAEHISESGLASSNARLVPAGSIVFSTRGTVGNLAIAGLPLTCNQSCEVLIPKNNDVSNEYLYYLLNYGMFAFHRLAGGTTFGAITRREIGRVYFALPERAEQTTIAHILDTVDSVINISRDALQSALILKTALLQVIFKRGIDPDGHIRSENELIKRKGKLTKLGVLPIDWDAIQLGKLCTYITDGTHQATKKQSNGIPFLFVSCIKNGKIDFSKSSCISESKYVEISSGIEPRVGAVLYTVVGSYGNAAIVEGDNPFAFERNIAFLLPNSEVLDPKFLVHWLNSEGGRKQAEIAATGNAQKLISLTALKKIRIAVPKLKEQQRIVEMLEPVDALIDAIEVKLRNQDQLKKSLMHDLLTGKVRVNPALFKETSPL
jgi:type I restriction enzyme S subunit